MDIRIEDMEVAEVDLSGWKIRVGPISSPKTKALQYNAKLLSPVPQGDDGSGMFPAPKVGDLCTVLIRGTEAFILGFRPAGNFYTTGYSGANRKIGMEEGDLLWMNRIGMVFKASMRGSFHWITSSWSKIMIGRTNQELRGWFRNVLWRMRGGKIEWNEDRYLSVRSDKFEEDINDDSSEDSPRAPIAGTPGNPLPTYANKEIQKFGFDSALSSRELRGGAEEPGDMPNRIHKREEQLSNGTEVVETIQGPNGTVKLTMLQSGDKYRLEFLPAEGPPLPYCVVRITEEGMNIAHNGYISIGGQGQEQQLVTKQFVEDIFVNHTHLGNNGAPTSAPLNVSDIVDPELRDSENHFTKDTKAE